MGNYHMGTFTSKVPIRAIWPDLPSYGANLQPAPQSCPARPEWELSDSKFPRSILRRPARDSADRGRTASLGGLGVRPDKRGPRQPGKGRSQGCGSGRWFLQTQRPHRHGQGDGRRRSAYRSDPALGAMAAERHDRAIHPGLGRRRDPQVAEPTYTIPTRCKHPVRHELGACRKCPLMWFYRLCTSVAVHRGHGNA